MREERVNKSRQEKLIEASNGPKLNLPELPEQKALKAEIALLEAEAIVITKLGKRASSEQLAELEDLKNQANAKAIELEAFNS
jgi:hypothetical protein